MCMCLARGGVGGEGGEWMRGLGLGFTNGNRGVLDVCLCFGCGGVGGIGGEWGLGSGSGGVRSCYVCVSCESGISVLMAGAGICIVLGEYLRI